MFDLMRKHRNSKKSLQQSIITKILTTALISAVGAVLLFAAIIALYAGYNSELRAHINNLTDINTRLLTTVAAIFLVSLIAAALTSTIYIGLPFSNKAKKMLYQIRDANESLSRGKVATRLKGSEFSELDHICAQFNLMASRTQKQVESLQKLVNENKILLQETEKTASLEERKKIARDLHDAVSQQLFAISISLKAVNNLLDDNPDEAKEMLTKIEEMAQTAQKELRALIMQLRPVKLKGLAIHEALPLLLKEINKESKSINFNWEIKRVNNILLGVEECLYRIAQEIFSNIIRHSKATNIYTNFHASNKVLHFFVEDDGVGFDTANIKQASYGLSTMEERVAEIGGRLDIISVVGKGTRIEIRVPLYHEPE